jgi:aminoglycoside phosphotransferase (APT) family kinase protein
MSNPDKIYQIDLSNRQNSFYWQTDRDLSPKDYERIFLRRHDVSPKELETVLRDGINSLGSIREVSIQEPDENVTKGNVNIVRKVQINGNEYVARLHPKGLRNGYFYAETEAFKAAKAQKVPVPTVIEIHEATHPDDMAFILTTVSPGITMTVHLENSKTNEVKLLFDAGKKMAQIHKVKVEGFGSFNNQLAKNKKRLVGLHSSYHDFIHSGLEENLERLIKFKILTPSQAANIHQVFDSISFEPLEGPRLIHNDFADWNLLTDGHVITAVLDWDESHAGDPVADLACWSTFFNPERMESLVQGYITKATLPDDYETRFHYYRLRYTISKMALRIKRYQVDKTEFLENLLKIGKQALIDETKYFAL